MGFFDLFFPPNKEVGNKKNRLKKTPKKVLKEKEWKDPNEQNKYVCEAGKVMCYYCMIPIGDIKVTSNTVSLQDRDYVTVGDNNGKINLIFKGTCMHPSQQKPLCPPPPCKAVIATTQWENYADTYINNYKALLVKSTIPCMISQQDIKIIHSGQKALLNAVVPVMAKETSPYLFYKKDGTYLAGKETEAATVYITDNDFDEKTKKTRNEWDDIKDNSEILLLNHGNLKEISAIANGEAWQNEPQDMQKEELYAIANTVYNHIIHYKTNTAYGLPKGYSYAKDDKVALYTAIKMETGKIKNGNWRKKTAMAAGINALLSNRNDNSNGATFWDGIDVLKNENHYRYRAHSYFSYIKGIYDPENLRKSFLTNAQSYGDGKDKMKELKVISERVTWNLGIESEKSVLAGHKDNNKRFFELLSLDGHNIVSKDLYSVIYKGPGHNLWYYPENINLYEVVAQKGLSIFYVQTDKLDPDEVLKK